MFFSFFLILYFNKPLLTIFRNSDQCFLTNYTNRIEVSVSLTSYRVLSKQQIEIKRSMSAIFHVTTAIPSLISQIIFNQSQGFPIINMSLKLSIQMSFISPVELIQTMSTRQFNKKTFLQDGTVVGTAHTLDCIHPVNIYFSSNNWIFPSDSF